MVKREGIIALALLSILFAGCESMGDERPMKRREHMVDVVTNEAVRRIGYSDPNRTFDKINNRHRPYDKAGIEYWVYDLNVNIVAASHPNRINTHDTSGGSSKNNTFAYTIASKAASAKGGHDGWVDFEQNGKNYTAYYRLAPTDNNTHYIVVASTLSSELSSSTE